VAKHYEALQRAEAERRRKVAGDSAPVMPVDWDTTPASAPTQKKSFFTKFIPRGKGEREIAESSNQINKRRISMLQPDSFVAEQFRMLRGRIDSLATQQMIKTVAMTSANPDEGKSTAAINLAVVTSMSLGRRVLLIDCDLRKPKIHRSLGLEPGPGLAEVLDGRASLDEAIIRLDEANMDVLPVRAQPVNPSELLASAPMRQLIEDVSGRYDQVILDTPACLGLPDSKIISELCDGIVLVVRANMTAKADVDAVLEILDRRRILGLLLNGVDQGKSRDSYYY
jgi:capsular exopolysaccharide synthesis family protein